ncbi:MAG TPA: hypothetical protein V6D12_24535 [Candidatus Obscuribacterales bacterium]
MSAKQYRSPHTSSDRFDAVEYMFEISQATWVNSLHQGCYAATTPANINPQ